MYQIIYVIESARKNLIRTQGLLSTLIIVFFIGFFSFTGYYLLVFFQLWKNRLREADNIIALLPVTIFSFFIFISCFSFFIFLVIYTKNSFRSLFFMQKNDIQTMSLLGSTSHSIGLEFAIQPVICFILILPITAFLGKKVVNQFITDVMSNLDISLVHETRLASVTFIIFLCCMVVFFSTYFSSQRLIKK